MSRLFRSTTRVRIGTSSYLFARQALSAGGAAVLDPTAPAANGFDARAETVRAIRPRVQPQDDAVRLALRLRECEPDFAGRTLLFAPVTDTAGVARLAGETALGLAHLESGPVIVVDLNLGAPDAAFLTMFPTFDGEGGEELPTISLFKPGNGERPAVPYLASEDFSRSMDRLKARAAFVLCVGRAVPESVETMLIARQCDALVLSVTAGRTTLTQVQKAVTELRRRNQAVFGFVMDASGHRASRRG